MIMKLFVGICINQKAKKPVIFGTGEYGKLAQYYFTHDK